MARETCLDCGEPLDDFGPCACVPMKTRDARTLHAGGWSMASKVKRKLAAHERAARLLQR